MNNIQKFQLLEIENSLMQDEIKHLKRNMIENYDIIKRVDKIDPKWKNRIVEITNTHHVQMVWNTVTKYGIMLSEWDGQFTGGCSEETWNMDDKIYSMSFHENEKLPFTIAVYIKE